MGERPPTSPWSNVVIGPETLGESYIPGLFFPLEHDSTNGFAVPSSACTSGTHCTLHTQSKRSREVASYTALHSPCDCEMWWGRRRNGYLTHTNPVQFSVESVLCFLGHSFFLCEFQLFPIGITVRIEGALNCDQKSSVKSPGDKSEGAHLSWWCVRSMSNQI